ncbi:MAG TPA: glycosyl hydrolase, partial [Fibrobacteraceae bacterium]|nr:glycosyl hydrolase [Fibrobacteraceae bacterium]
MKKRWICVFLLAALQGWGLDLTNPNATTAAQELYSYLQNLTGRDSLGILSGQESMIGEANDSGISTHDEYVISKNGGKIPALYASNFGDYYSLGNQEQIVKNIKNRWATSDSSVVVMLCWHAVQPDTVNTAGYTGMSQFSSTNPYPSANIDSILTPGTELNVEWIKRIDSIGVYLLELQDAGIPVIWRPFHENNGAFFWWGQQKRFPELWKQMYDYYTDTLGLDNLIWDYSVNYYSEGDTWLDTLYPGDSLVDVLSVDVYTNSGHEFGQWLHDDLRAKGGGKPIGISENGPMPNITELKATQPYWTFFCTWFNFEDSTYNSDELYDSVYSDVKVVTQDEINYNITADTRKLVSVTASGEGEVTKSPDSTRISAGSTMTLTAAAASGYEFTGWTAEDGTISTTNPITFTVNADTSIKAIFEPQTGTNVVQNSDFSTSIDNWKINYWDAGEGSLAVDDSMLKISVTSLSGDVYNPQVIQTDLLIDSGYTYSLSFDAKSSGVDTMDVAIGQGSGDYTKLLYTSVALSDSLQSYSFEIPDTLTSEISMRLEFEVGYQEGTIWLDNVVLKKASTSAVSVFSNT